MGPYGYVDRWPFGCLSPRGKKVPPSHERALACFNVFKDDVMNLSPEKRVSGYYPIGKEESVFVDAGVCGRIASNSFLPKDREALKGVNAERLVDSAIFSHQQLGAMLAALQPHATFAEESEAKYSQLKMESEALKKKAEDAAKKAEGDATRYDDLRNRFEQKKKAYDSASKLASSWEKRAQEAEERQGALAKELADEKAANQRATAELTERLRQVEKVTVEEVRKKAIADYQLEKVIPALTVARTEGFDDGRREGYIDGFREAVERMKRSLLAHYADRGIDFTVIQAELDSEEETPDPGAGSNHGGEDPATPAE